MCVFDRHSNANLAQKPEQVRKPKEAGEEDVPLTPCPISGQLIPNTSLECPTTKDPLPMCVVSGQHIVASDFCLCPRSGMPARYSEYVAYLQSAAKAQEAAQQAAQAAARAEARAEAKEGAREPEVKFEEKAWGDDRAALKAPQQPPPQPPAQGAASSGPSEGDAVDPVMGLPVALEELVLLSPEDAALYIAKHNQLDPPEGKPEGKDGAREKEAGPATDGGRA